MTGLRFPPFCRLHSAGNFPRGNFNAHPFFIAVSSVWVVYRRMFMTRRSNETKHKCLFVKRTFTETGSGTFRKRNVEDWQAEAKKIYALSQDTRGVQNTTQQIFFSSNVWWKTVTVFPNLGNFQDDVYECIVFQTHTKREGGEKRMQSQVSKDVYLVDKSTVVIRKRKRKAV